MRRSVFAGVLVVAVIVSAGVWHLRYRKADAAAADPPPVTVSEPPSISSAAPDSTAKSRSRTAPVKSGGATVAPSVPDSTAETVPAPASAAKEEKKAIPRNVDWVLTAEEEAAIKAFGDTRVPLQERQARIQALAKQGDESALKILAALGNMKIYLNRYAVEAVGDFAGTAAGEYLAQKLQDGDALIICAAVRALQKQGGAAAIDALTGTLKSNNRRADGHGEMVQTAVVEALGNMQAASAIPALTGELERSEQPGWSLEYGSAVVQAIARIGRQEARTALLAYADRLQERMPDDPVAKTYFEAKIAEARELAGINPNN